MGIRPLRGTSGVITRLLLLGLLDRDEQHGYEIQATLRRWRMDWWADVQSGSIYAGLARLEREGLVEEAGSTRNGLKSSIR